jgi:nicotinamidase-related amidase
MKTLRRILLFLLVLVVLVGGVAVAFLVRMGSPTKGPQIAAYPEPKTALLVIDIQEDFTGPEAKKPFHDAERLVRNANALIGQAREHGALVVFIENVIDNPVLKLVFGGVNTAGTPGVQMDRRLVRLPSAPTFTKNRGDAFINPALDAYLSEHQVGRLLIVGLDAAYCVTATTRGARNRGYETVVLTDAVATESGKSLETLTKAWQEAGAKVMPMMKW